MGLAGRESGQAGDTGGEGGIRTPGAQKGTAVFETAPINRSGTSPAKSIAGAEWGSNPFVTGGDSLDRAHSSAIVWV
jgi:hypothetical protein